MGIKATHRATLEWKGPVEPGELPSDNGVYMALGDHPVYGNRALLYIGKSSELNNRVKQHATWLQREWRPEVYFAVVEPEFLDDVEALLIYAHSPAYNGSGTDSFSLKATRELSIWNTGSFFRLLPEITSSHPWYADECRSRA